VRRLAVIATARSASLSLDEIKLLVDAADEDRRAAEQLRAVAERKLPELVATIERAEAVRRWLEDATRCECPRLEDCPLFDDAQLEARRGASAVASPT
jgi:MerR family transcriptional regulator, redox-sensitive transcriptional activator SoxR